MREKHRHEQMNSRASIQRAVRTTGEQGSFRSRQTFKRPASTMETNDIDARPLVLKAMSPTSVAAQNQRACPGS